MESVHIVHFYGYPCCIWPVYTWGKEWAPTWWETKECLQKEQRDPLSFLLERELGGLPTSHSLFQVSLECEIQHLPLFYLNQVFVSRKRDLDDWFRSNKWRLPKWERTGYISRAWVSALITYVWPTQRQEGSGELLYNKREDFKDPWQEVLARGSQVG